MYSSGFSGVNKMAAESIVGYGIGVIVGAGESMGITLMGMCTFGDGAIYQTCVYYVTTWHIKNYFACC
jgi:hypothetical protein